MYRGAHRGEGTAEEGTADDSISEESTVVESIAEKPEVQVTEDCISS